MIDAHHWGGADGSQYIFFYHISFLLVFIMATKIVIFAKSGS